MDALDLFFKKYSYKFPKGYPDLTDKNDMILLESLLNEILDDYGWETHPTKNPNV